MVKKSLTLSIVIPAYNEEHHLKSCLDAIAAQTEKPEEVIVVDNNSTDKTAEIARSYPFVRLLHEGKQGVLFARDTGFDAARGDIIGRIDSDTVLPAHWIRTVKAFLEDPEYAAVNGPVFYYDMPFSPRNYWIDHQARVWLYRGDRGAPFLFGSNSALRKSAWQAVRADICRRRDIHEDLDLAIHVVQAGMAIRYDKQLLAGTSARRCDDSLRQWRRYMAMYLNSYRRHHIRLLFPRLATSIYWLGYFFLRPLQRSYDYRIGKRSIAQLFRHRPARKNPMTG